MHDRRTLRTSFLSVITLAAILSACGGGGSSLTPTTGMLNVARRESMDAQARSSGVTLDDARLVAQQRKRYFKRLTVAPKSLYFSTGASQTIAVSIPNRTAVYAATDDERIASVALAQSDTSGRTTITLTVTPHANGRA